LTWRELDARATLHDKSKFSDPEKAGYVFLNWTYHCKKIGLPFQASREVEGAIHAALSKHRSGNLHHPEAHECILQMSKLDMVEMVADWHAISRENGTGPGSTAKWARENIVKWEFSVMQHGFIEDVIEELDKTRTDFLSGLRSSTLCKRKATNKPQADGPLQQDTAPRSPPCLSSPLA
jgi:hypothetical protein